MMVVAAKRDVPRSVSFDARDMIGVSDGIDSLPSTCAWAGSSI